MRSRARASVRCSPHPELIELARRVIPPYSLAQPTIEAALRALEPAEIAAARARIAALLEEREYLRELACNACRW